MLRVEDRELTTGAGDYTADLPVEGAYHVAFVRSPIAHGTITSIEVGEAAGMPGARAVYTVDDIGLAPRQGLPGVVPEAMARPHLAHGKVRFVGDIVAAVVADSAAQAHDAAEFVVADIEALPAVVGIEEALADGVALVFDEAGSNLVAGAGTGEVEGLFDGADTVVRARFHSQRLAGVPMEPNACVARPGEPDGGVTLWLPTQAPNGAQATLAGDLGLDPSQVRVIAPRVGGGFGAKAFDYLEWAVVAKAALLLGHPVRWTETRSENLLSMVHGRAQLQHVELGLTSEGRIVGLRADVIGDAGAYPAIGTILPSLTQLMSQGVYDIPAIEFAWRAVATTTTTIGAYRGAGRPEATQMLERILDIAADETGIDPLELRRRNLIPPDRFPLTTLTGAPYDNGEYAKRPSTRRSSRPVTTS